MKQRLVFGAGFAFAKIFILTGLFLVFNITGCSSGGGGSSNGAQSQDAVLYQQALDNYQAGNYSQAQSDFQNLVAQYPNSIYVDNSQYYVARCHHQLQDFNTARTLYDAFLANYSTSNYVDNAVFYRGKSYYDEAQLQTDAPTEYDLLQNAVTQLQQYIVTYPAESLLDAVQYYLAHSYHDQAKLLLNDATLSTNTSVELFNQARSFYDQVIANAASVYTDNAQYFKAQTYHDAADYVNARTAYTVLIDAGGSIWADDAKYQYAKTYYDDAVAQTDPNVKLSLFDTAITEFGFMISDPLYQTSNRLDSAYYFKGRSYQRQGALMVADNGLGDFVPKYSEARAVFQQFITLMPASSWADNALYQRGATFYDEAAEAERNTDYVTMREKISNAIGEFSALLNDSLYQTMNSADNAQYYLGRSYQMILTMPANERIGGGVDLSSVTYDTARAALNAVIQNFPGSAWIDNAYYEIGNTYYDEATAAQDFGTAEAAYNNALSQYYQVINLYAGNSITEDNAVYNMGLIFHDTGYCVAEKAAFEYARNIEGLNTTIGINIEKHLQELTNAPTPTGAHLCDTTNYPNINTNFFTGTQNTASLEQNLFTVGVNLYGIAQYPQAIDQFNTQLTSYPDGEFADNAHLYIGRSNYWQGSAAVAPQDAGFYTAAENEFLLILADFGGGDVVDGAQYWLARTYHATGRFDLARTQYAQVPQGSGWYDSAIYAIGKTYYDESKTAATPAAVLSLLLSAEQQFDTALKSMATGSSSVDNTVYFLARSYQEIAGLLAANPTLTAPKSANEYLALARNNFQAIVGVSNYADDAAYQIGKTYYEEADLLQPTDAMAAYDQAVAQFDSFINDPNFANSNKLDSVYYFQGRSLYKQAKLVKANPQLVTTPTDADTYFALARTSFLTLLAMIPVSPTWNDDAQYYLARSYHEQLVPDYVSARDAYQVLVADQTSPWADDAKYQLGRSYYDEAQTLIDPVLAINAYTTAVTHFDGFIVEPVDPIYQYPASNRAEEARYYKGRSLHEHALLVIANPGNVNITGDTALLFADARTAYGQVTALDPLAAYADNAQYYIGKSHYDETKALTNGVDQMNSFDQAALALESFDPLTGIYKDSSYANQGLYFLGRAQQKQGELLLKDPTLIIADNAAVTFDKARTAFQDCITVDAVGTYADNAQYQIGATYFDEANDFATSAAQEDTAGNTTGALNLYTSSQQKLNNAINTFTQGFSSATAIYPTSTYADNAQYFMGRSYHMAADIPVTYRVDLSANVDGINFIAVTYADARAAYLPLTTEPRFASSAWVDNAYYEIGNTYFSEAEVAVDNLVKEAAFNSALENYAAVVNNFPTSIRFDNAVFQIAWIYHLGEYCSLELEWFQYHGTLTNVSASNAATRDSHLADLEQLPSPTSHVCPAQPTLLLSTFNAPQILP